LSNGERLLYSLGRLRLTVRPMADINDAQALLRRRMGIRVVCRLLSLSEKDHCDGGDDIIPEVNMMMMMMIFLIMTVAVMLS